MYPAGHYGIAMLLATPVAFFLGRRAGTVFSAFVLLVAVLPDLDKHLPFVTHHGVTHTFLFAALGGFAIGTLAAVVYRGYIAVSATSRWPDLHLKRVFVWATTGAFFGIASHVMADVLVLLPGKQPISPFWPVFDRKLTIEVIPLGAPVRNVGILLVGLVLQLTVYRYQ